MSSYWKLEGEHPEDEVIQLYWSSSRSSKIRVLGTLVAPNEEREFESLEDADQWAYSLGVRFWIAIETVRAYPIACKIPIRFLDAPENSILEQAIEKIASGAKLRDIANQLGIHPGLAKYWLIGAAPQNECLAGFKR